MLGRAALQLLGCADAVMVCELLTLGHCSQTMGARWWRSWSCVFLSQRRRCIHIWAFLNFIPINICWRLASPLPGLWENGTQDGTSFCHMTTWPIVSRVCSCQNTLTVLICYIQTMCKANVSVPLLWENTLPNPTGAQASELVCRNRLLHQTVKVFSPLLGNFP